MKRVVTVLLALVLLGQSRVAVAGYDPNESTPRQVGYGAGSAFTVIVSRPTASKIVGASCRGTWAITPDVLKGKEKLQFVGEVRPGTAARKK